MKVPFQDLKRTYNKIYPELNEAYERVMQQAYFILGPEVELFEKKFAEYCGTKFCVGVGSGLDALTLSLMALKLNPGDEVIVPANTYIATWIAITRAGLKPVPVDADMDTLQIDVNALECAITQRTKVIMPVHLYFQTSDIDRINEIAKQHSLRVISDAAQAHGIQYKNRMVGALCDAECFSFYPTKNLGAFGDGGAVTTNDPELYEQLIMLRNYGTRSKYVSEVIGVNSRLDELQAAFLSVKLSHLDEWNEDRRRIARLYFAELENTQVSLPTVSDFVTPNWYIFPVLSEERDRLKNSLSNRDVGCIVHYPVPPYLQTAYKNMGYSRSDFPVSSKISENILSLPIYPYLSREEILHVSDSIKVILKEL